MMKPLDLAWLAAGLMTVSGPGLAQAATPVASATQATLSAPAVSVLQIHNPPSYAGIQLGDVLQRRVQLAVAADNPLIVQQLPIKGVQRNGIELRDIRLTSEKMHSEENGPHIRYTLVLDYQLFTSAGKPQQLQLPAERLVFQNGATVEIPAWRFWQMAQIPDRLQPAKPTLIAQYRPALLPTTDTTYALLASLVLVCISGLILLFRNADWTWLPLMNGPFARAYRHLKRLPNNPDGQKQAALLLQQAFNQRFGQQMLASHIPAFVAQYQAFQGLESQIHAAFGLINTALYGQTASTDAHPLAQYKTLTRQFRACERRV